MPLMKAFFSLLDRRPLLTQMVSAGAIGCTGDALCQLVVQRKLLKQDEIPQDFDFSRSVRFFILPCFFIAPTLNIWFRVLERIKGRKALGPIKKVVIDQTCFAPWMSCSVIFNLNLLEGNSPQQSWKITKNIYWDVHSRSLMYWPLIQLVNFYAIPLNFRVIFVQLAALFWNMFISYKTTSIQYIPIE